MLHLGRVLCPVDLSDTSRNALDHAVAIARWYSAALTVLHVYTPLFLPAPGPALAGVGAVAALDAIDDAGLTARVNAFVAAAVPVSVRHDVVIDSGSPAPRILDHVQSLSADLVVMGTHGASGFEHVMLGSIAEKVLHRASCPVMVVPPAASAPARLPFQSLLCPIDFSPASVRALDAAFDLARQAHARLMLLHVLDGPRDDEPVMSRSFNVPEYRRLREEDAGIELSRLVPPDARCWCEPELRLSHGVPHREVLRLAADREVDVIVMGVHDRTAVDVAFFGSTTNHVVREAKCPVLTVREHQPQRKYRTWREAAEMVSMPA